MSSDAVRDSSMAGPSNSTAVTGSSEIIEVSDVDRIVCNNRNYATWADALAAVRKLVDKSKDDSSKSWFRTDVILEANGSFSLRCSTCEKSFMITNPSNFWSSHKKKCSVPKRGQELTRGVFSE
jgi:hypothetical protein